MAEYIDDVQSGDDREDWPEASQVRDLHLDDRFQYNPLHFGAADEEIWGEGDALAIYAAALERDLATVSDSVEFGVTDLRDKVGLRAKDKACDAIQLERDRRETVLYGRTTALKRHWIFGEGEVATWTQGTTQRNCVIVSVSAATGAGETVYRIVTDNTGETAVFPNALTTKVVTYCGSQDEREKKLSDAKRTLAARTPSSANCYATAARRSAPTGRAWAPAPSTTTPLSCRTTPSSCAA